MARRADEPGRSAAALTASDQRLSHTAALQIVLQGRVQGLGVRPAIARLAGQLQLSGSVANDPAGVRIEVEGPPHRLDAFLARLPAELPAGVRLQSLTSHPTQPRGRRSFTIGTSAQGPLQAEVPPDLAGCSQCVAETSDATNRRRNYLLATCTGCGPRYSIIREMPYERHRTTMVAFEQCGECRGEDVNPSDRRFHAQTNGCASCGPRVWLHAGDRRSIAADEGAVAAAARAILAGRVLVVRGVGGYQLVVDATSAAAVSTLRRRKGRPQKPLAVMVADLAAAESLAQLTDAHRNALTDPANPIVLVRGAPTSPLAAEVSAGLTHVGIMLPTTPLHHRLVRQCGQPLVVTSGNREGEPLAFADADEPSLAGMGDVWLEHDRPIARPIDDSVVHVAGGQVATVRLARGLAPLPLPVAATHHAVALGGHLKSAIALSNGAQAVLGPHLGDLDSEASRLRYVDQLRSLTTLYGCRPEVVIHDRHPDYFTSRLAAQLPGRKIVVQHHHAHVAAGMLQHGWLDRTVLGVAWDGTGYGADGSVWGGEFLLATLRDYRRVAALRPFGLPGGEAAVRQPWRVAVALATQAVGEAAASRLQWPEIPRQQVQQIVRLIARRQFSPPTTSAGRLFDGLAALAIGTTVAGFEAQGAMLLEQACDAAADGAYVLPLREGSPRGAGSSPDDALPLQLDWRPMVQQVLTDRGRGTPPGVIAMRIHRALADGIMAVAGRFFAGDPVVLQGGCFLNRVLVDLVAERWTPSRPLGLPGVIPAGDGGLAAGQLAVGLARLSGGAPCV